MLLKVNGEAEFVVVEIRLDLCELVVIGGDAILLLLIIIISPLLLLHGLLQVPEFGRLELDHLAVEFGPLKGELLEVLLEQGRKVDQRDA